MIKRTICPPLGRTTGGKHWTVIVEDWFGADALVALTPAHEIIGALVADVIGKPINPAA